MKIQYYYLMNLNYTFIQLTLLSPSATPCTSQKRTRLYIGMVLALNYTSIKVVFYSKKATRGIGEYVMDMHMMTNSKAFSECGDLKQYSNSGRCRSSFSTRIF